MSLSLGFLQLISEEKYADTASVAAISPQRAHRLPTTVTWLCSHVLNDSLHDFVSLTLYL